VVATPVILMVAARERVQNRRFRVQHEGTVFFCYSVRRGWREFVLNNVRPVLPHGIEMIQMRGRPRQHKDQKRTILNRHNSKAVRPLQHPYILRVDRRRIEGVPLHADLFPLKRRAARDPRGQAQVRAILERALKGRNASR
jgi:hypothetical protein